MTFLISIAVVGLEAFAALTGFIPKEKCPNPTVKEVVLKEMPDGVGVAVILQCEFPGRKTEV